MRATGTPQSVPLCLAPASLNVSGKKNQMKMNKTVIIWLIIIFIPALLWVSMFVLGLVGLAGFWGYYSPLWFFGEPFFKYSSDTGWFYPTIYGLMLTPVIYSLIYWLVVFTFRQARNYVIGNR